MEESFYLSGNKRPSWLLLLLSEPDSDDLITFLSSSNSEFRKRGEGFPHDQALFSHH